MSDEALSFFPLSEEAVLIRFGSDPSLATHQRIQSWTRHLTQTKPEWLRECVPAITELALVFRSDRLGWREVVEWLKVQRPDESVEAVDPNVEVLIPVHYGGEYGPDLEEVARRASLSVGEVIQRHQAPEYRVAMLGFTPGFPYLIGLDPALKCPRRNSPRLKVPKGAVGIAGSQTGIYSCEGPGGWQIIGRTGVSLFDPEAVSPFRLQPGDRVRFVAETETTHWGRDER